ncbi:prepilin-type N-terminal cleavage/methylation domain-containing protein [Parelusimicrobium proximum]|uniref:type IV pilin protein n=1 Tax=Parelusimicrobium proximum TaxID=3228953 RepID=UPI003D1731AE
MKKGFTLIELLVVVLIIAVLAAVALPMYSRSVDRANMTEGLLVIRAVGDAQQRYLLAHDEMPENFEELDISLNCKEVFTGGCRLHLRNGYVADVNIYPDRAYFMYRKGGESVTHFTYIYFAGNGRIGCLEQTGADRYCSRLGWPLEGGIYYGR